MAKRRYYRTTALLGAQPMGRARRRGGLPSLRLSWRMALPLVLLVAGLFWLWLDARWYVTAARVEVEGASPQRAAAIVQRSGLQGRHGLWVDEQAVEAAVASMPAIRAVEVERHLYPAGCRIVVEEREPSFAWVGPDGRRRWVADDGVLFSAADDRALPEVVGPLPDAERLPPPVVASVRALFAQEPHMTTLVYNPRYGLVWRDGAGEDVVFGLGNAGAMVQRWRVYRSLTEHLQQRGLFPLVIDVRFPEAPAYSLDRRLW